MPPPAHPRSPPSSFLTLPRPPTSTLFPYTTLFRSHSTLQGARQPGLGLDVRPRHRPPGGRFQPAEPPGHQNRKSTRLNSSHSQISYAVFCLKKKKKNADTSCTLLACARHDRPHPSD